MAVVPGDLETAGCSIGVDGDGADRHVHRSYAVRSRKRCGRSPPGPWSTETRLSSAGEPRDRPRHKAIRQDDSPRRPDLRGRPWRGVRLPRRERGRQDDDDADRPRHRGRRRRGDHAGTTGRSATCRAGRGATCPRSVASYPRMTILDQLVYFARCTASTVGRPPRRPRLARPVPVPEYADRRAEQLSKGNQQKVQFIAAVLHSRTRSSTSLRPASSTRTSNIRTRSRSQLIRPPPRRA